MAPRHLIDAHAHFHWSGSRDDHARYNASRLDAGDRIGITYHVASILGTWGRRSPTYFASPDDAIQDTMLLALRAAGVLAKRGPYQFPTCAMLPADITIVGDAFHTALSR